MGTLARGFAVLLAALGLSGGAGQVAPAPAKVGHVPATVVHLLAGARSIDIRSAIGSTSLSDRASVRKVVTWFDALPQQVIRSCAIDSATSPTVRFAFRDSRGRALLRVADHDPGHCTGFVGYARNGRLADDGFVAKVSRLLGESFEVNAAKTAANRLAAKRDVTRILRLLKLPPGARRVAKPLSKELRGTVGGERSVFWKVPLPFDDVVAFENAHHPRGATVSESGSSAYYSEVTSRYVVFSFRPRPGISSREIYLYMAPLKDGSTGVRADVDTEWVVARSSLERVPAGVKTIEIRKSGSDLPWHPKGSSLPSARLVHRVTAPKQVAKIVRWIDEVPILPGLYHPYCMGRPPDTEETFTFLDASGHKLAEATAQPFGGYVGECYPMTFSVVGEPSLPPLLAGGFPVRVEKLLRR